MRNKKREVTDLAEITAILAECTTLRLAINAEPYPYIVPVSFGIKETESLPVIYFHCAPEGLKLDLIAQNPGIAFEADEFIKYEPLSHGITARYKSVIGTGRCSIVNDRDEIISGLHTITAHCGYDEYDIENCGSLEHVTVCRIDTVTLTGKRNLPPLSAEGK